MLALLLVHEDATLSCLRAFAWLFPLHGMLFPNIHKAHTHKFQDSA
jgi:hypothetical protein